MAHGKHPRNFMERRGVGLCRRGSANCLPKLRCVTGRYGADGHDIILSDTCTRSRLKLNQPRGVEMAVPSARPLGDLVSEWTANHGKLPREWKWWMIKRPHRERLLAMSSSFSA